MGTTMTMDRTPSEREPRTSERAVTPAGIEVYPAFAWVWLMPISFAITLLIVAYIALHAA